MCWVSHRPQFRRRCPNQLGITTHSKCHGPAKERHQRNPEERTQQQPCLGWCRHSSHRDSPCPSSKRETAVNQAKKGEKLCRTNTSKEEKRTGSTHGAQLHPISRTWRLLQAQMQVGTAAGQQRRQKQRARMGTSSSDQSVASVRQGLEEQVKVSPKEREDFQMLRQVQSYVWKGWRSSYKGHSQRWIYREGDKSKLGGHVNATRSWKGQERRPMRTIKRIFQTQFFGPRLPQLASTISAKSMCSVVVHPVLKFCESMICQS